MSDENFSRLPVFLQDIVTAGLDGEIENSFARIEQAQKDGDDAAVSFFEGDVLRASGLREKLTGDSGRW